MKNFLLAISLLASAWAWAGEDPIPAEYTVAVHVSSSNMDNGGRQNLGVVIDGKNYSLLCECTTNTILVLGDYKAKLVKDEHRTAYDFLQVYEFLFADKKTRKFEVVGQSE